MTFPFWMLILVLAIAAFSIRVLGLFAGDAIKSSRFSWMLDDMPGLIVVSLVASSLADQSIGTWIAAAAALAVAYVTNHVIWTMCVGVAAYGGLVWAGL
ncbi:MAG: AzlD domain-containing protein [Sneathiella sp.]|uniref:AzlD domain-containing protein n=1 Tax=Sneathiella sp. TaxID=1964365 RepID=UPI003003163F